MDKLDQIASWVKHLSNLKLGTLLAFFCGFLFSTASGYFAFTNIREHLLAFVVFGFLFGLTVGMTIVRLREYFGQVDFRLTPLEIELVKSFKTQILYQGFFILKPTEIKIEIVRQLLKKRILVKNHPTSHSYSFSSFRVRQKVINMIDNPPSEKDEKGGRNLSNDSSG